MINFIISVVFVCSISFAITSCNSNTSNDSDGQNNSETEETSVSQDMNYDTSKAGYQLETPADDEEVVVMHTSKGDIVIRFFPDEAPKAVENFTTLAKDGYYDGIIFHRVIDDFMIQGGDPTATGSGGESMWGEDFEDEFSGNLLNLRGSVAMANAGPGTNGSQFFINQAGPDSFIGWDAVEANAGAYRAQMDYDVSLVPENVKELYEEYGGNFHLDGAFRTYGGHTVFGQVVDGMDVVDEIASLQSDGNGTPSERVTIDSIEFVAYGDIA